MVFSCCVGAQGTAVVNTEHGGSLFWILDFCSSFGKKEGKRSYVESMWVKRFRDNFKWKYYKISAFNELSLRICILRKLVTYNICV